MNNAKIIGVGKHLPKNCYTNDDISKYVDTSDEWIYTRTGIKSRYLSTEGETNTYLAKEASLKAIKDAGINKEDIDCIIFATYSPDYNSPNSGALLQKELGITANCFAFELNAACTGFVYALSTARAFISAGQASTILVVGSEVMSRTMDWNDRSTCVLFGDGAGAVIVQKSKKEQVYKPFLRSEGSHAISKVAMPLNNPLYKEEVETLYTVMNGQKVFMFAVKAFIEAVNEGLKMNNITEDDLALIIPHQANSRIIDKVKQKMNLKTDVFVNIDKYGNTTAATIPIALQEAKESGKVKSGDKVLLVGFGGGLTWGSILIEI